MNDNNQLSNFEHIFQKLDTENKGYISVESFHGLLKSFYDNPHNSHDSDNEKEQHVTDIITLLDPQNDGKIYINDFKVGLKKVFESSGLDSDSIESTPDFLKDSQETLVSDLVRTPADECDTDDVFRHFSADSVEGDSGVHSVSNEDAMAAVNQLDKIVREQEDSDSLDPELESAKGIKTKHALDTRWANSEEAYEDWGAGEPGILIDLSTPPPEPRKPPPHPDTNHLNPLQRGTEVRGTWPRRRSSLIRPPSANQLAHELHSSSSGRTSPVTRTSGDGMYFDDLDTESRELALAYQEDMSEQLRSLTDKMEMLTSSQAQNDSKHGKLREENQHLLDRIHRLEDEYRDAEARHREERDEDKRRAKEKLQKVIKDRDADVESLTDKLRMMETTSSEYRLEAARFKSETERLKLELARSDEKREVLESRLSSNKEETERSRDISKREMENVKKERDHLQNLLEQLNSELEGLRGVGAGSTGRERTSSAVELLSRYREVEQLAKRLTAENKALREQLEETQGELLARGVEEGQALLRKNQGISLASELETLTKDEVEFEEDTSMSYVHLLSRPNFDPSWEHLGNWDLMDLLVKEKDGNQKLRSYVDKILLKIMEKQPELLEVAFS